MKKRILSILLFLILSVLSFGCTSETNSNNKENYNKNTYNLAYITIRFYTAQDKGAATDYFKPINNMSSGNYGQSDNSYFCRITDWEYGENDTIILYLTDGRTLQTSTNNVLLMYEPDLE